MNYSELFNKYIKKSGLSWAEITRRLHDEKNIKIDRSYISMLKNGKTKYPASDEINRAIAEITRCDPNKLVMAGYHERAPIEVKEVLDKTIFYEKLLKRILLKTQNFDKETQELINKFSNLVPRELDDSISEKKEIDVSDEFLFKKYNLKLDGKSLREKDIKLAVAFLRTALKHNEQ
ncbi:hypothetical protein VQL36_14335 [Chengkuizengella sp. SCS-71B]|uniref:hypothetical protein n=1 Tax=Chengkuizengella sp. SCS-71B TaxID=3115290 RepID=UPI0032C23017